MKKQGVAAPCLKLSNNKKAINTTHRTDIARNSRSTVARNRSSKICFIIFFIYSSTMNLGKSLIVLKLSSCLDHYIGGVAALLF